MLSDSFIIIAKTSFKLILSFLILFIPVIFLNWLFLVIFGFSIFENTVPEVGEASRVGMLGIVIFIPFLLVVSVFLLLFPFLYFLVIKKIIIQRGLNVLVNHNKVVLIQYILNKLFEQFKFESLNKETVVQVLNKANSQIVKLNNLPFGIGWIVNHFVAKVPFAESLLQYVQQVEIKSNNIEIAGNELAVFVNEKINLELFDEKKTYYYLLLGINVIAMVVVAIYLT